MVALVGAVVDRGNRDGAGALAAGDGERGVRWRRRVVGRRIRHLVGRIGALAASVRGPVADGYAAGRGRRRQRHRELDAAAFSRRGGGNGDLSIIVCDRHCNR